MPRACGVLTNDESSEMLMSILCLLLSSTTQHCQVPNANVPRLRNPVGFVSAEACRITANAACFSFVMSAVLDVYLGLG